MQSTEFIWFNGQLIPWQDAKVHVLSHTLHYGSGAFEGIRFYNTERGPAIFQLVSHVERLLFSANALHMSLPYSKEDICTAICDVVRANKLTEGYIRPIAFFGYDTLGVNPKENPVEFAIACWKWGAYLAHDGVDIKTSNYIRIHPDSTIVNAKFTGHYINSVLASLELKGTHYHEALFLDSEGYISEGAGENFFMMKKGEIYTPKLGTILPGITRLVVIKLAKQLGFNVIETNITLEEAYAADEAFFTGTAAEVTLIHSIDDKVIGNKPAIIIPQIQQLFAEVVCGKVPEYESWLTWVK